MRRGEAAAAGGRPQPANQVVLDFLLLRSELHNHRHANQLLSLPPLLLCA